MHMKYMELKKIINWKIYNESNYIMWKLKFSQKMMKIAEKMSLDGYCILTPV